MGTQNGGPDFDDIPDSTDWLGTPLSALMPLEQAFRCHVCKDFYNAPMLTSCNHTFCSLCIRRSLSADGKCPLCRANDQESKLRGNYALREAVDAFVSSRPGVLQFARTQAPRRSPSSPPKRKASSNEVPEAENHLQPSKRPRMSTRASKTKATETMTAMFEDEVPQAESIEPAQYEPADGLAACPICLARMKLWQVDKHLDTSCPGFPQPQAPSSRTPNNTSQSGFFNTTTLTSSTAPKPLEKLTPLNYSILRDQALRKKMSELGISTSGSRQLMENRHKEWVTIWNANCDSSRPKSRAELLNDLNNWERTQGGYGLAALSSHYGAQIKDKNFDGAAWATQHDSSFKDLVANARRSKLQAEKSTDKSVPRSEEPLAPPEVNRISESSQTTSLIDLTGSPPRQSSIPLQPNTPPPLGDGYAGQPSEPTPLANGHASPGALSSNARVSVHSVIEGPSSTPVTNALGDRFS